jgi:precorrin-3B C17-methyltransferase
MSGGRLDIVGLGPGPDIWLTQETPEILTAATDLVGYIAYVERIPERAGQNRHASDNRVELDRARHALTLAQAGARVALVSGGDPGVFAMAAAAFEAIEAGDEAWRGLDVVVHPGISAMLAAAARLGAPLGHDFCAISLSDNLKPWPLIERRIKAAAEGDFVMAFYNPASRARPQRIHDAFALLRSCKPDKTVVALARAVGRPDERIELTTLADAPLERVDMSTLVLVGSEATRLLRRADGSAWVYTPRSAGELA